MSDIGQKLIAAVRKHAADNPTYVDDWAEKAGCQYVRDGEPSCIIGQALWDLGFIDSSFETHPPVGDRYSRANADTVDNVIELFDIDLDPEELHWLVLVQGQQDSGRSWADAVTYGDDNVMRITP